MNIPSTSYIRIRPHGNKSLSGLFRSFGHFTEISMTDVSLHIPIPETGISAISETKVVNVYVCQWYGG